MHASGTAVKAVNKNRAIEIMGDAVNGELGDAASSLTLTNSENYSEHLLE